MRTLNQARDLTLVTMNCSTTAMITWGCPLWGRSRAPPRHHEGPASPAKLEETGQLARRAPVLQVRRTRIIKGRRRVEVVYAISSVPMEHATPQLVATWIQGHWSIESALYWVRDVTVDWGYLPLAGADRHQLRFGNLPHVMAILGNTAIRLLRLVGWTAIAAGHDITQPTVGARSRS